MVSNCVGDGEYIGKEGGPATYDTGDDEETVIGVITGIIMSFVVVFW